jgi:hypothetical protein
MSQELREPHSQLQAEKRHRRYTLIACIGLFLIVLSLGSWVVYLVFIFSASNIPAIALARIIPPHFFPAPSNQPSPNCLILTSQGPLIFTVTQGQSNPTVQPLILTHQEGPGLCPPKVTWSGKIVTYQGTHWLSISPTQSNFSSSQSVSIIVSSSSLTEGVYRGLITFTTKTGEVEEIKVAVDVARDRQHASIGDIVAYTTLSNLNVEAKWPLLIKDRSVNMTISLLSSRNLPRNLPPAAATPTTEQHKQLPADILEKGDYLQGDDLLENAFGSHLVSLAAQLDGTAFGISSNTSPPLNPNQRIVSFHWNIIPRETGPQVFELYIAGQWENDGGLRTTYFLYSEFSVNVDESPAPFITFGQLSLSALLLTFLGSLLNVPWIIDYFQKRKEKKQEQHANSSSSKSTPTQPTGKQKRRSQSGTHKRN